MDIFLAFLTAIGSGFGIIFLLLFKVFKLLLPLFLAIAAVKLLIWLIKVGFKKIFQIIKNLFIN